MVEEVTLDSSVFVSAFVQGEQHNRVARVIMKKVFDGNLHVVTSAIVPVEVSGAISRRASVAAAKKAMLQMQRWSEMKLIEYSELTERRSRASAEVAAVLRVRGMDAIVIQTAKERQNTLVTFDEEMAAKAKEITKVAKPKAIASKPA